jgi:hypothetical protein
MSLVCRQVNGHRGSKPLLLFWEERSQSIQSINLKAAQTTLSPHMTQRLVGMLLRANLVVQVMPQSLSIKYNRILVIVYQPTSRLIIALIGQKKIKIWPLLTLLFVPERLKQEFAVTVF